MADIPGNATTGATITVGGTIDGTLETTGDQDWYRLQATGGQTLTIFLTGVTLEDPYLRIRDSSGNIIFERDDISPGVIRDSRISFEVPSTGTYYVDVGAWVPEEPVPGYTGTGTYQLSVKTYTPPPEWTIDQVADFLARGYWGGEAHPFDVAPGGSLTVNITALTPAGQTLALQALDLWSDVIGVSFVPVATGGQIVFDDNESGAFADNVYENGISTSAHVNVSVHWLQDYGSDIGGYAFQAYVHEVGHALGLGHGGYYNSTADYFSDAVYANDGWPVTIMSYFSQNESDYFNNQGFSFAYLGTPMVADIGAMQMLYGLSTTTRTGDTTYGFNSTADSPVYNAGLYSDMAYTVFDSGGADTLDYSGYSADQSIDLTPGSYSNVGGYTGNVWIAHATTVENAIGGAGDDVIRGNQAGNVLRGGSGEDHLDGFQGDDQLSGEAGADQLTGGAGSDSFLGTASGLNNDTITDFAAGDRIVITNASLATFSFSVSGSTLTYSGGSLTLAGGAGGQLVASAAAGGGVQLALGTAPPPPPPPSTPTVRSKLLLTQSGQDFMIGGNVAVFGTTAGGEVIEVLRGDITLDASFNAGGDTVVLPGAAGSYSAILSGSFVTISNADISIAIPVGLSGLAVQFGDSTRTLRIDGGSGQVMLGSQAVTAAAQTIAASGPPLADAVETGPDTLAKLILTQSGQDVDIAGNVSIFGTAGSGEVITVLGGTVRLDASFNAGGDTVVLPGSSASYSATLSGSFVTIADGDLSVAIPVGLAGLTVDFSDTDKTLRIDPASGQVMLGTQVVTSLGASAEALAPAGEEFGLSLAELEGADAIAAPEPDWTLEADYSHAIEPQRIEANDAFYFG